MNIDVRSHKTRYISAACAVAVLGIAGAASASVVQIADNAAAAQYGYGTFTGSIAYSAGAFATDGALTISLTNTSDVSNGGFLTGFVFNINSVDANAGASLVSGTHAAMLELGPNEPGNPFGTFDSGAALGGSFLGNGNPGNGIGVGATGVFEFLITASDAASLTAMSFITGPNNHNFVARFRGFDNDESDTVPGMVVPAPAAVCLLLGGIIAGGVRRRR